MANRAIPMMESEFRGLMPPAQVMTRSAMLSAGVMSLVGLTVVGCGGDEKIAASAPDKVWGRRGLSAGTFNKPRAIAIYRQDQLYIVDMTARIQFFTADGQFVRA